MVNSAIATVEMGRKGLGITVGSGYTLRNVRLRSGRHLIQG
ncbi:MAG: hypothetical protein ACLTTF_03590 [Oscillospiraceae bacterium]